MTKEEFIKKVYYLDKIQGNYELTKRLTKKRNNRLNCYPGTAIAFFEWLLKKGETVYVYEDIFRNPHKEHLTMHFFLPKYRIGVRFESKHRFNESTIGFRKRLRSVHPRAYIFFIKPDDTLVDVIKNFERVLGYQKECQRNASIGNIIKPKRPRMRIAAPPKKIEINTKYY